MQKQISTSIFYSLLFAMGGAPTIAMLIIRAQTNQLDIIYPAFIALTVMIACILVPIILLQNAFLFFKRQNVTLETKIKPLSYFYLALDALCLLYWLAYPFLY